MDSQQQFCLKWNSFGSNLAAAFSNLFKSESLADVTLFCEGVTFKAHKLILAACSKHLADLFETAPLHQNLLVILDGTSAANMSALLEFMYKGEVHVSQDCLSSFLKAAECLQVKGLSIEHEKLAVAQHAGSGSNMGASGVEGVGPGAGPPESPTVRKHPKLEKDDMHHPVSSPSYSPVMSPYMHPHHYRQYDQRLPYDRKRHLPSPDLHPEPRASVLRDGTKRPQSPNAMSLAYRPSSSSSAAGSALTAATAGAEADAAALEHRYNTDDQVSVGAATSTFEREEEGDDVISPEDLRMKMEPQDRPVQEEPLSSTVNTSNSNSGGGGGGLVGGSNGSANGAVPPTLTYDPEKADIISASMWNSVQGKLGKAGSVTTPDGKKLKCPFCERLYGYETNLRAHIRQRHQGIRVPCPFCSRTFTRNNTVRRHIAREHKAELSLKAFQQQQTAHGIAHNHTQ